MEIWKKLRIKFSLGACHPIGFLAALLVVVSVCGIGSPTASGAQSTFPQVSSGKWHSCGITTDSLVTCWGTNINDQTSVPSDLGPVSQVSAGGYFTCAIKVGGTLVCWEKYGQSPAVVPGGIGAVTDVSAGHEHTCAVKGTGTVVCWGDNQFGRASVPGGLGRALQVSAGEWHSCAVKIDQTVACWGDNTFGESTPPGDLGTVKQVAAGGYQTCAVKTNGVVICWGDNSADESTVPGALGEATQVTASEMTSCAVNTRHQVFCWGVGSSGQANVPANLGPVSQVAAGDTHVCATKTNGQIVCWGADTNGKASPPGTAFPTLSGALVNFDNSSGLDFGDVHGGERSVLLTAPILSRSLLAEFSLSVKNVNLTGNGNGAFSIQSETCTTAVVENGKFCTVRVRLAPQIWQRGEINGSVTVTDDSAVGSHVIPLTGSALAPPVFVLKNFSWALAGNGKQFNWETSDDSKVTITLTQLVKSVVTVKKGKKKVKKLVTAVKPVTLVANLVATAGPAVSTMFNWDGKVAKKPAAKGNWTVAITATSSRGKATLSKPITIS